MSRENELAQEYRLLRLGPDNLQLLQQFLETAGQSLESFRYFSKRGSEVLQQHLVTYLLLDYARESQPVCYGHLDRDPESERVWLGVAVIEGYYGRGLGAYMVKKLIDYARQAQLAEIYLSVDRDNSKAIQLYHKFAFELHDDQQPAYLLFRLRLAANDTGPN